MRETINRKHKDRLFCSVFKEKKELLSLYNAVNGTNYTDEEELTVTTLDNAIYMTMKNDVSFLIYGILNLYEHQSTWNPNMPLRDFLYVANQLKSMIEEHGWDIYGSKLIRIPTPQAVVFYNGKADQPERQVLKLSDAFENKDKQGCMEFECLVLNINYGKNKELMERCNQLRGYAILIDRIRRYTLSGSSLEQAVDRAIEECIQENILEGFLRQQRSEVKDLILSEYDEQKHIENEKRWSWEDGKAEGVKLGKAEGVKLGKAEGVKLANRLIELLLSDERQEELHRSFEDEAFRLELMQEYGLINE